MCDRVRKNMYVLNFAPSPMTQSRESGGTAQACEATMVHNRAQHKLTVN